MLHNQISQEFVNQLDSALYGLLPELADRIANESDPLIIEKLLDEFCNLAFDSAQSKVIPEFLKKKNDGFRSQN